MSDDTILLEAECGRCHRTHDVFGEELAGQVHVDPHDLRCPACSFPHPAAIRPRESLA